MGSTVDFRNYGARPSGSLTIDFSIDLGWLEFLFTYFKGSGNLGTVGRTGRGVCMYGV